MQFWVFCAVFLVATAILFSFEKTKVIGNVLLTIMEVVVVPIVTLYIGVMVSWGSKNGGFLFFCVLALGGALLTALVASLWGRIKNKKVYIPVLCVAAVSVVAMAGIYGYEAYINSIPTMPEGETILDEYTPYAENSKTVDLGKTASLRLSEDLPKMDGATALYPVYAAFGKAVYPKAVFYDGEGLVKSYRDNNYVTCTTTANAYSKIVTGEADIIFVASPNKAQDEYAKGMGVELVYTPIGKEAFVFFVNAKNPVDNMTLEDIQKIYSGEITAWSELGVKGFGNIRAFQREEGSGSQSTLVKLMAGKNLKEPEKEDVVDGMGGIISQTADYKNYKNALGYSFRFYSTQMVENNMIKLLKINSVAPTLENIENGTYPITGDFYAVTRSDADENTLKMLEWIQSEEGQKIVEMTGYTPIK